MQKAIGILGGTFDPIHFGHLRMGVEMAGFLGLTEVRFIPASLPPHRSDPRTPAHQRAEMVRLGIAGNPLFNIDLREIERAGPSYMFDTLSSLRLELGSSTPLYLLLGADAFLGLPDWHRWRELFNLAHIAVANRPGSILDTESTSMAPALRSEWKKRHTLLPSSEPSGCIIPFEITALDISASTIRKTLEQGKSPQYLLPEPVIDYILKHNLYSSGNA